MKSTSEFAYGKLNLTLDVLGVRGDGYHEMRMIMQTVDLCDRVTVTVSDAPGWTCICDTDQVPTGMDNLALRAADAFFRAHGGRPSGLSVSIEKKIPMQGGMAGGSADAAAVLRALNRLYGYPYTVDLLAALARPVGSDVPFCVLGGTVLAEGRGEILTALPPIPDCSFVLVKPEFSVSTPLLFSELDRNEIQRHPDTQQAISAVKSGDLKTLCRCVGNVFQPVLAQKFPVVDRICRSLLTAGALGACLTGTGSVVFGIFETSAAAQAAATALQEEFTVFTAKNV